MSDITFYAYSQQPPFWIARDDDGYWLVPVRQNGWHDRSPFIGRVNHLHKIIDLGDVDLGLSLKCVVFKYCKK
jgi:hypothetical protein